MSKLKWSFFMYLNDLLTFFDEIDHDNFLNIPAKRGVAGSVLSCFKPYLTDGLQYVSILGMQSTASLITSSLPQSSHLGSLLFVNYLNNIKICFKSTQIKRIFLPSKNIVEIKIFSLILKNVRS